MNPEAAVAAAEAAALAAMAAGAAAAAAGAAAAAAAECQEKLAVVEAEIAKLRRKDSVKHQATDVDKMKLKLLELGDEKPVPIGEQRKVGGDGAHWGTEEGRWGGW